MPQPDKLRMRRLRAADYLDISPAEIDKAIAGGSLPAYKDGRSVFVYTKDLDAYAARRMRAWEPAS